MRTSNMGTNGEKNIEEIIKKDSVIKKSLDKDEVVEHISYKKGMIYKFFMLFLLIEGIGGIKQGLLEGKGVFDLIVVIIFILPLFIFREGYISKFVVTNKGTIITSAAKSEIYNKAFCTDKFYYSEIKEIGWSDLKF